MVSFIHKNFKQFLASPSLFWEIATWIWRLSFVVKVLPNFTIISELKERNVPYSPPGPYYTIWGSLKESLEILPIWVPSDLNMKHAEKSTGFPFFFCLHFRLITKMFPLKFDDAAVLHFKVKENST